MKFFGHSISPRLIVLCALFVGSLSACAQPPEILPEAEIKPLTLAEVENLIGGRTAVSLQVENAEMPDVLAAAKRETGFAWRLAPRTVARGPVTLNLKDQPIWALYDALRGEIEYNRRGSETALGREEIPLSTSTLFQPLSIQDKGLMQLRAGRPRVTNKHWIVPLTIFVDPKLELVPNSTRVRLLSATDEKGNDLLGRDRLSSWYRQYPLMWGTQIAQLRPDDMGEKITNLSGVLQCSVVLKREPWEIPLKAAEFPVFRRYARGHDSETLSIDAVTVNADGTYEVQATRIRQQLINPRFMPTPELRRMEVFNYSVFNSIKLLDAQGREFPLVKSSSRAENEDATLMRSVTAIFGRAPRATTATPVTTTTPADAEPTGPQGEPALIVWSVPTEMRPVEVPFEFTDLPLTPAP